jgi:peptidoglycan LD-endopeptidase CwlK
MILQNPRSIAPQSTIDSIVAVPVTHYGYDGVVHQAEIEVHKTVVDDINVFFDTALTLRFPIDKVVKSSDSRYEWDDTKLLEDNATSGFNFRTIAATDKPSLHAQGLAIDVNTRTNPYIAFRDGRTIVQPAGAIYDPNAKGALTANHPLVRLMKKRGWTWGGDWTQASGRIDYQHFEKRVKS